MRKTIGVCKGNDGPVACRGQLGRWRETLSERHYANTNLSSLCRIVPTPCCHVFLFLFFFFFSLLYSLYIPDTCPHVAALFLFLFFFFFSQKKHSWLLFYTRACSGLPQNAQKDELFKSFEERWCWVLTDKENDFYNFFFSFFNF